MDSVNVSAADASATNAATSSSAPSVPDRIETLARHVASLKLLLKDVEAEARAIQREYPKAIRQAGKRTPRAAASGGAAAGFKRPVQLSAEMCAFLGVEPGTTMARTEATKGINDYIKQNKLHSEANKRVILPDDKLRTVLSIGADEELTYFNLQRYIKHNFTAVAAAPAPAPAPAPQQ